MVMHGVLMEAVIGMSGEAHMARADTAHVHTASQASHVRAKSANMRAATETSDVATTATTKTSHVAATAATSAACFRRACQQG